VEPLKCEWLYPALDAGFLFCGTCGKDGQAVPVGVGIPTIKIDRLTVGGTAKKDTGGFMQ